MGDLTLTSSAFGHGDVIPRRHACDGEDVSPGLSWSDPPADARALVLVVDDPDAPGGVFTHWLAANIDARAGGLAEAQSPPVEGRNDFGTVGWRGPCPPRGHGMHRYVFRLHAVDAPLDVGFGSGRQEFDRALADHVLATAELVGTYQR